MFSIRYGQKDEIGLKENVLASFVLLAAVTAALNVAVYAGLDWIIWALRTPAELVAMMHDYLRVIFAGLAAVFLYNFFASLLRSLGDSATPLAFLAVSAGLNIVLDLWFVAGLGRGVAGAAEATVIAQYVSGLGIAAYTWVRFPDAALDCPAVRLRRSRIREIAGFSALTCLQQSIMNLGILAVQGLVNSFGTTVMAAFAAAVKIDAFAYLPVQDFGNAFSIFISQNYGAGQRARIRQGIRTAAAASVCFGLALSGLVFLFAPQLMALFIDGAETAVIAEGVRYLRIEGRVLRADRPAVFAVRAVPRAGAAGHVGRADRDLAGAACVAGLRAGGRAGRRRGGHLVERAGRLASGRCVRPAVLPRPP